MKFERMSDGPEPTLTPLPDLVPRDGFGAPVHSCAFPLPLWYPSPEWLNA